MVDNRAGGGGLIATTIVVQAPVDEFAKCFHAEVAKRLKVIRDAGIQAD